MFQISRKKNAATVCIFCRVKFYNLIEIKWQAIQNDEKIDLKRLVTIILLIYQNY